MVKEIFLEKLKAKDRFVRFKALIPAGEAKPVAPLGPLLGQYGVNLVEFCSDFNKRTESYTPGVMIPVIVQKMLKEKTYKMDLKAPNLPFLLFSAINSDENDTEEIEDKELFSLTEIEVLDKVLLFDLIRLSDFVQSRNNLERSAKIVFGFLSTTNIKIID